MLEQSPSPGKSLALVVDDEPFVRMNAVDVVEEAGFAVLEASNADEAIAILAARTDNRPIDVPVSMDDAKLSTSLKRMRPWQSG